MPSIIKSLRISFLAVSLPLVLIATGHAAAIAIGCNGLSRYVQVYDIDTDSATSVWSGANYMGGIAYDSEQDDVYFYTEQNTRNYLWRDNEPTVFGNVLEKEKEVYTGISDTFDFVDLDVASQSRVVYAYRNPDSSSRTRITGITVRDVATNVDTPIYTVSQYVLQSGTKIHTNEIGGIAADSPGEWVYFSDSFEGTMNRVRLDGTGGREILLTGLARPGQVAVYGSNVYWVESDVIRRSDLLGDAVTTLITPTVTPYDIAVGEGRIYWTSVLQGDVVSAVNYSDLNGNNIQTLGGNAPVGTLVALASATAPVPEPTSLALWSGLGALGLIAARRRRKQAA